MTYDGNIRTARVEIGQFTLAIQKLDGDRERIAGALRFIDDHGALTTPADDPDFLENLIADMNSAFAQTADVANNLDDASMAISADERGNADLIAAVNKSLASNPVLSAFAAAVSR